MYRDWATKNNRIKRIAVILFAFIVVTTVWTTMPLEANAATQGEFIYTISNGEVEIDKYIGGDTMLSIPSNLGGYSVTSIGSRVFENCSSLTSITIPSSVKTVAAWAFDGCLSLRSINVSSGSNFFLSIDGVLFDNTQKTLLRYPQGKNITSYAIPSGVMCIGDSAFFECSSLESITIPSSVTSIESFAFYDCSSLIDITIPSSVKNIDSLAFDGFYLETIYCEPDSVACSYAISRGISYILIPTTYPVSEKTYMVTFTAGGETLTGQVAYGKKYGKLPKVIWPGHKFVGWYTKKSGGKKITSGSIVEISKDHTLYAHWKEYKVTFLEPRTGRKLSKMVIYGEKYGELPKVTESTGQLKFLGWYTKKSGGKKITAKSIMIIKKNTTLYAHWKRR